MNLKTPPSVGTKIESRSRFFRETTPKGVRTPEGNEVKSLANNDLRASEKAVMVRGMLRPCADAELQAVIEAWPELSEPIRTAVVVLIRAATR